jgi:hypothetical protein
MKSIPSKELYPGRGISIWMKMKKCVETLNMIEMSWSAGMIIYQVAARS